jgi:hypothetical protein
MHAQIRPNRLVVNDRFPMLGFTVRGDGTPQRAEITIATTPDLFHQPADRSPANFYSSSEAGPLSIGGAESVYVVPSEVLARFIGAERIYFGLATAPADNGNDYEVVVTPTESSPYIAISGLTGRSLRRVRLFPRRTQKRSYAPSGNGQLTWSGDKAKPGMEAAGEQQTPGNGNGQASFADSRAAPAGPADAAPGGNGSSHTAPNGGNGQRIQAIDYDDGFGPLPPLDDNSAEEPEGESSSSGSASGNGTTNGVRESNGAARQPETNAPTAQSLGLDELTIGALQNYADEALSAESLGTLASLGIQAAIMANPVLAAPFTMARAIVETTDVSVGIGPKVGGGVITGVGLGVGIILAPGGRIGVYGAAELDLGVIASVSATMQFTVLRGGIESFDGISKIASVSGGEGIVGGVTAIFDANDQFLGVSVELGIGIGDPFEIFVGVQRGVARQLGYAAAYGLEGPQSYALVIGPEDIQQARRYAPRWRDLFNWRVPSSVAAEVRRRGMSIQRIQDSAGSLNLDKYSVRCTRLPTGYTAESLLDHIRRNMNSFVDTDNTEFNPYSPADRTKWNGSSPVGAIFNLDIIGPDNAAVVGSMVEPRRFRFTTIETPDTGSHPVSGHREFGLEDDDGTTIIYTRGADRSTWGIGQTLVFAGADHLWKSFQDRVVAFINSNGGSASKLARFSERFHPDVVRILYGSSSARSLGAGYDPLAIEVKYRMFIPSPVIKGLPHAGDFGGDGRSFSYDSGTSRGEITSTVHLTPGMGVDRVVLNSRHWGESTEYDDDDTYHVNGKPDWWLDKQAGAQPTERATLAANDDNLRIVKGASGTRAITSIVSSTAPVTIHAAGAMPLSAVAPDIDADVTVLFRNNNGLIQAKAVGKHDGFPAHELYVNGETIYRYDPVAAGNGPISLAGYGDIELDTDWKTVSRTNVVRIQSVPAQAAGAGNQSFTINWDEVHLIPQPTNHSCWAASAAMLIGWRDRMSLTPETIANLCGRSTVSSERFTPSDIATFATDFGLHWEEPQSYTEQGFIDLLENNGPLWVVKGTPPTLHAIVVTGVYRDGAQLYVRITDPWDRTVGTPGAPGPYASTHTTGSRYIMTWQDFATEYESAITSDGSGTVNLQIVHSGGTNGRQPNRGASTPAGYAQSKALEFNESFTINWDEVELVAQPTSMSCWATSAAMVIGWRDRMSLSPQTIAEIGGRSIHNGLDPAKVGDFAQDMGLVAEAPMSYTMQGFRELLEDNGPLWVGAAVPSLHVIVVTGVYNDEDQMYVRVTDPWDRTVGTPGSPGGYLQTHATGSRYILTWEDFVREYERAATDYSRVNLQILHSGGTDGRQPNRGVRVPPGYALADVQPVAETPPHPGNGQPALNADGNGQLAGESSSNGNGPATAKPPANGNGQTAAPEILPSNGALPDAVLSPGNGNSDVAAFPPPGATISRTQTSLNGVEYDLAHLDGVVLPIMPAQVVTDLVPGERIVIDEWPYIDSQGGRSRGGVAIDWSHAAGAVANVYVHPHGAQALDGWQVRVVGDISAGPSTPTETKLKLTVRTTFAREGEAEQSGVSEIVLCGSGKVEKQHKQEEAADQPSSATELPSQAPLQPQAPTRQPLQ